MGTDYGFDPAFGGPLSRLLAAAGGRVGVSSGRRSTARQAQLWNQALVKYGSPERARKWVAPPGRSRHETGNAADLTGDLGLAHRLAPQFGLRFRLGNEPWHIEPGEGAGVMGRMMPLGMGRAAASLSDPAAAQRDAMAVLREVLAQVAPGGTVGGALPPDPYERPAPQGPTLEGGFLPTLPSPADQAQTAAAAAAALRPSAYAAQLAAAQARMAGGEARASAIPPAPVQVYTPYTPTAAPVMEEVALPVRPDVAVNPWVAGLAALAGMLDPTAAGMYGVGPIDAAVQAADREYADRRAQYEALMDAAARRHSDALAMWQAQEAARRGNLAGADAVANANSASAYQRALAAATEVGDAASAGGEADALLGLQGDERAYLAALARAQAAQGTVEQMLAARKEAVDARQDASRLGVQALSPVLQYMSSRDRQDEQVDPIKARRLDLDERIQGHREREQSWKESGGAAKGASSPRGLAQKDRSAAVSRLNAAQKDRSAAAREGYGPGDAQYDGPAAIEQAARLEIAEIDRRLSGKTGGSSGPKKLDRAGVAALLREVGGDAAKARALAKSRGYTW